MTLDGWGQFTLLAAALAMFVVGCDKDDNKPSDKMTFNNGRMEVTIPWESWPPEVSKDGIPSLYQVYILKYLMIIVNHPEATSAELRFVNNTNASYTYGTITFSKATAEKYKKAVDNKDFQVAQGLINPILEQAAQSK